MSGRTSRTRTRPTVGAARAALGRPTRSTIGMPWEDRLIVVAQGIEFHNSALPDGTLDGTNWQVPECVLDDPNVDSNLKIPGCLRISANEARYANHAQRVNYTIRRIQAKAEYHTYLETADAHVVYQGHARYGRGPCLGPDSAKGNHWGNGTAPATEGIYRMGYPYLEVPLTEALYYQYRPAAVLERTSDPAQAPVALKSAANQNKLHPQLRAFIARAQGYTAADLVATEQTLQDAVRQAVAAAPTYQGRAVDSLPEGLRHVLQALPASRLPDLLGQAAYPDNRYWAYRTDERIDGLGPFRRLILIHYADWENTPSGLPAAGRMDLGATNLACTVFCHFGCSTYAHNFPILRQRKAWRRQPNDRFAYWTTNSAFADITPYWLYHILTYIPGRDRRYPTRKWRDVLAYAVTNVNNDLNLAHRSYEII